MEGIHHKQKSIFQNQRCRKRNTEKQVEEQGLVMNNNFNFNLSEMQIIRVPKYV